MKYENVPLVVLLVSQMSTMTASMALKFVDMQENMGTSNQFRFKNDLVPEDGTMKRYVFPTDTAAVASTRDRVGSACQLTSSGIECISARNWAAILDTQQHVFTYNHSSPEQSSTFQKRAEYLGLTNIWRSGYFLGPEQPVSEIQSCAHDQQGCLALVQDSATFTAHLARWNSDIISPGQLFAMSGLDADYADSVNSVHTVGTSISLDPGYQVQFFWKPNVFKFGGDLLTGPDIVVSVKAIAPVRGGTGVLFPRIKELNGVGALGSFSS